jgi:hypothetical protein
VIDSLSEGWLIASYQGHAAFNVLAHEGMLQRNGLTGLTNNGRPFIFFGMGCHVSDFLQWEEGRVGSPIGEYIVTLPERGAIASYGSSGFEFLDQNAAYMEEIADVFFRDGRVQGMVGGPLRSQWILGEVLAQSELNGVALPLAFGASEMVAQYNLLGDPLLRVDALPPRLRVGGAQGTLEEGADLQADTGSGVAALTVDAVDETGISHLDIVDSKGRDESGLVQWSTGVDPRRRAANLELPILPQTYDVEFSLFDGSYPRTRPTTLTLHVQLGSEFFVDGEPFDALAGAGFPVGRTVSVELRLNSPVDLTPSDIGTVSLEGGSVGTVSATGSGRQWTLNFDVTAESETGQRLSVELGSVTEEYPLSSGPGGGGRLYVESHFPYPNPARLDGGSSISVVARASEAVQWARLVIYDLSGRLVYQRRDDSLFVSDRDFSLRWDGRTRDGHEVANGTYFYRLEVGAGTRTARSDMGRIVVMR